MYIRGLIARNFAEFGDAVPIVKMVCPETKTDSRIYVKIEKNVLFLHFKIIYYTYTTTHYSLICIGLHDFSQSYKINTLSFLVRDVSTLRNTTPCNNKGISLHKCVMISQPCQWRSQNAEKLRTSKGDYCIKQ